MSAVDPEPDVELWFVDTTPTPTEHDARIAVGALPTAGSSRTETGVALGADEPGADVLDAAERERARCFASPADAARYVRAHVAARELLAARTGLSPTDVRWEVATHGKPGPVVGQRWNLSRSGDHALVALAETDVGVDVQVRDPRVDVHRLAARFLAPRDARSDADGDLWRRFSRLEACAKAVGGRLLDVLGLDVRAPGIVRADDGPWRGQEWWVSDVAAPAGAVAACATPGPRRHALRTRVWDADRPSRTDRVGGGGTR
ncbi:4'-phosphopantetheinyl transferase family protein [Cellulosimicrobium sp. NPDC057862]|uniref:4'-phosphopantetheinyl transferase family protein n=1 Tax=Cellulosimicrobium sp. NPDC057862 TaxID=3346266 RepID=UPI0036712BF5